MLPSSSEKRTQCVWGGGSIEAGIKFFLALPAQGASVLFLPQPLVLFPGKQHSENSARESQICHKKDVVLVLGLASLSQFKTKRGKKKKRKEFKPYCSWCQDQKAIQMSQAMFHLPFVLLITFSLLWIPSSHRKWLLLFWLSHKTGRCSRL